MACVLMTLVTVTGIDKSSDLKKNGSCSELSGARDLREAWQSGAVPVIHLDQGKASVDQYLRMFPEQFLGEPQVINKISQTK